jgi:peptidoglycan/LPS O-acetylase OafA/YrhL
MNWTLISVFLFLALILLIGVKIFPKDSQDDFFSLDHSKGLQGFFALCILFHHLSIGMQGTSLDDGTLSCFENIGTLCVGFFFFCSGYGLITSLHNKEGYLNGFLKKRVFTVLVPFFICNYTYILVTLLMGQKYNMGQLIAAFFGVLLLNTHLWFAVEIMFLYLAFYFLFRYIKKEKICFAGMTVIVVALIVVGLFLDHPISKGAQYRWMFGDWWFNTTVLFLVGMLVANTRSHVETFVRKWYFILLPVCAACFAALFYFTNYLLQTKSYWSGTKGFAGLLEKMEILAVQMPMVTFFVLTLLLIMMRVHFHNHVLKFLGKISLESILMNNVFIFVFLNVPLHLNSVDFIVLSVISTTVVAAVLCKLKNVILEKK